MRTDGAPAWAPPLMAVQFLTRLRVPPVDRLDAAVAGNGFARAMGWLPLAGTVVGLVTAGVFVAVRGLWPVPIAVLVALMVEARLTGALHEDAVADFCDAFGGGRTSEEVRRILKDSRIGSYGALGLILAVGLRIAATIALPWEQAAAGIVAAASFGRLWAVLLLALCPPVVAAGGVASGLAGGLGAVPGRRVAFAVLMTVPGLAPLAWMRPGAVLAALTVAVPALVWMARGIRRRIGGSTGDCLGFAACAGQLAMLLAASVR